MWTTAGLVDLIETGTDLASIKAVLVNEDHIASMDDVFVADIVADELPGAPRLDIPNVRLTPNVTQVHLTADDPAVVPDADFGTVGGVWLYRHVTDDSDSKLWVHLELENPLTTNGGDLAVEFNSEGIAVIAGST